MRDTPTEHRGDVRHETYGPNVPVNAVHCGFRGAGRPFIRLLESGHHPQRRPELVYVGTDRRVRRGNGGTGGSD